MTTRADLAHGRRAQRIEIIVTKAVGEAGEPTVYEVTDWLDEEFLLAVEPSSDIDVEGRYRIKDGFGYDVTHDRQYELTDDHECPQCGTPLEFVDGRSQPSRETVEAIERLARDGTHLVVDDESTIGEASRHDDWRPLGSRRDRPDPRGVEPEFECPQCGLSVSEPTLRRRFGPDPETIQNRLDKSTEFLAEVYEQTRRELDDVRKNVVLESAMDESIGMSTGGGKDVGNFRENIEAGHFPDEDALTYEGLFYDYYFDTGDDDRDDGTLFYPTYSTGVSDHPLTEETEYYLTVGLNSTLGVDEFERRRLNLVAVLDVSGSMGSQFDQYYYDEHGTRRETDADATSKMRAATESLAAMTTHLNDEDRFGVVLYNSEAHVAKPLSLVGETDMDVIRGHIRDVKSGGGTNMTAGLETAIDLVESYEDADPTDVENRLVFMTDMMPNTGPTGRNTISGTVEAAADRGIYTTFVGMGIDANADLTESLSRVRGANHYFVHSATEFEQRLDEEFEFMVTPLVFDLQLELDGDVGIATVYGSPTADRASGRLMHVPTLFPSPTEDGRTRGGVVLVKLDEKPTEDLELVASWREIDGTTASDRVVVDIDTAVPEQFETTGVQKAVCLARYADVLRKWIRTGHESSGRDDWRYPDDGSQWERESRQYHVDETEQGQFDTLASYITETALTVGDDTLHQEVDLLKTLVERATEGSVDVDLSGVACERLRDIVEMAPTTNGELADAWGLDGGAKVHAYLERELAEHYTRGENRRIEPTAEGRAMYETIVEPS